MFYLVDYIWARFAPFRGKTAIAAAAPSKVRTLLMLCFDFGAARQLTAPAFIVT
jgi:hypothetical protein